jgi:hypothetical protein
MCRPAAWGAPDLGCTPWQIYRSTRPRPEPKRVLSPTGSFSAASRERARPASAQRRTRTSSTRPCPSSAQPAADSEFPFFLGMGGAPDEQVSIACGGVVVVCSSARHAPVLRGIAPCSRLMMCIWRTEEPGRRRYISIPPDLREGIARSGAPPRQPGGGLIPGSWIGFFGSEDV